MNYEIKNSQLMEVMKVFFEKNYPDIEVPLKRKITSGQGNSGYGSSMHDYTYRNYHYYSANDKNNDDSLFIQWDDRHLFSNEKWSVDPILENLYDFFGQTNFEEFVKWYFGIDITARGNKTTDWLFY